MEAQNKPRIILPLPEEDVESKQPEVSNIHFERTDKTDIPAEELLWEFQGPQAKKFNLSNHKFLNAGWKYLLAHRHHPVWMFFADLALMYFVSRLLLGQAGSTDFILGLVQGFIHSKIVFTIGAFFTIVYTLPFILDPVSDAYQPHGFGRR